VVTVASRRRIELYRADEARRRREAYVLARDVVAERDTPETDDALTVLLLCCHPALTMLSQVALTLRAVGGLTTVEIARAFLVPEATIAQRVSRAKQRIKEAGATFALPPLDTRSARIDAALRVLYLIFTEGHTASAGSTRGPRATRDGGAGRGLGLASPCRGGARAPTGTGRRCRRGATVVRARRSPHAEHARTGVLGGRAQRDLSAVSRD
jgi:predicted RNA polymerase sigma factor